MLFSGYQSTSCCYVAVELLPAVRVVFYRFGTFDQTSLQFCVGNIVPLHPPTVTWDRWHFSDTGQQLGHQLENHLLYVDRMEMDGEVWQVMRRSPLEAEVLCRMQKFLLEHDRTKFEDKQWDAECRSFHLKALNWLAA